MNNFNRKKSNFPTLVQFKYKSKFQKGQFQMDDPPRFQTFFGGEKSLEDVCVLYFHTTLIKHGINNTHILT